MNHYQVQIQFALNYLLTNTSEKILKVLLSYFPDLAVNGYSETYNMLIKSRFNLLELKESDCENKHAKIVNSILTEIKCEKELNIVLLRNLLDKQSLYEQLCAHYYHVNYKEKFIENYNKLTDKNDYLNSLYFDINTFNNEDVTTLISRIEKIYINDKLKCHKYLNRQSVIFSHINEFDKALELIDYAQEIIPINYKEAYINGLNAKALIFYRLAQYKEALELINIAIKEIEFNNNNPLKDLLYKNKSKIMSKIESH